MIRDIVEIAVNMVRTEQMEKVSTKAEMNTEERLLDLLLPLPETKKEPEVVSGEGVDRGEEKVVAVAEKQETTREKFRNKLRQGKLEDRMVEIKTQEKPVVMQGIIAGIEEIGVDFQNVIEKMIPAKTQVKKTPISEARKILKQEEAEKLIDKEKITKDALHRAENMGIIFIDELDKVASRESGHGPDISREGVQRDILPIVEGSTVVTRYGMVKTDRILFIAAGAFHVSKPSDLIPELQGRFPIRVELKDLGKEEFIRILTEPKNALIKQYTELLKTEGVNLVFEKDAIEEITDMAVRINRRSQSIGARRLHTVMEKLLEDASFDAPDLDSKDIVVDAEYVQDKMKDIVKDEDLTKYIL
jgi:ATP-dependent HslUV protease ATP-binding subunit HslU